MTNLEQPNMMNSDQESIAEEKETDKTTPRD